MMNPDTNQFEPVPQEHVDELAEQIRNSKPAKPAIRRKSMKADVFYVGEKVTIKSYIYAVESIEPDRIAFKPVGPIVRIKKKR